jgi:5-formyltetrahydrofolate cyclo-ligase
LRREFRQRRRALSAAEQRAHSARVARRFYAAGLHLRGRTIGLYVANDGELDPEPLLRRLLQSRKRVALPVVGARGEMRFYRYRRDTPMVENRFGIPEPAAAAPLVSPLSVDLLLLPLVAFDASGNRLGMGAGFYDRYLGRLPPGLRPRLIGLAHEAQRSPEPLPAAPWDVPLDGVLTDAGWHPAAADKS